MSTVILACDVLKEELSQAQQISGREFEVRWVDSSAHRCTDNLRESIQKELDQISHADTVILSFGFCGNAVAGLTTRGFQLVVPKAADCIAMLLHPKPKANGNYYITPGWLQKGNVWSDYKRCVTKFGQTKADKIYKVMLSGYEHITTIQTGNSLSTDYIQQAETMSSDLKLTHAVVNGHVGFFVKLLSGPWDDDFIVVPPYSTMELGELIV